MLDALFGLEGETAMITGAGGGLGLAHARALGGAGARLVLSDRDRESSERAAELMRSEGFEAVPLEMDVLDLDRLDGVFESLGSADMAPTILVNNAGVSFPQSALDATREAFDTTFAVNAKAPYFIAQAAARSMRERGTGGVIVNIASIGAFTIDGRRSSVYDASKAAIAHMTTNLAYEWAPHGIRVNSLAPGYIRTAMTEPFLSTSAEEDEVVGRHIPLGRVGEPRDLAGALVFLCSPSASWVTGHALVVDGGWMSNY